MNDNLLIRTETPNDIAAIHRVNAKAFQREDEAQAVDQLRDEDAVVLSLVAELSGQIVGHILFTPVTIEKEADACHAVGLAPLAVAPAHQNEGIGSTLVKAGLEQCRDLGHTLVFVVGHITYFPRFGFRPAAPLGFNSDYIGEEGPIGHFMVTELTAGALRGESGYVRFHPAFDKL